MKYLKNEAAKEKKAIIEKKNQQLKKNNDKYKQLKKAEKQAEKEQQAVEQRKEQKHMEKKELKQQKLQKAYKLEKAKNEAKAAARRKAMEEESLRKKRETKIRRAEQEEKKAKELAKAEREQRLRIKAQMLRDRESQMSKLKAMQKKIDYLQSANMKKSLVDLKIDGKPVGRLILRRGQKYDYNMSTKKNGDGSTEKEKKIVDLKVNGSKGPTPKIVYPNRAQTLHQVWVDNGAQIESKLIPTEKMRRIGDVTAAQVGTEALTNSDSWQTEQPPTVNPAAQPAESYAPQQVYN